MWVTAQQVCNDRCVMQAVYQSAGSNVAVEVYHDTLSFMDLIVVLTKSE